MKLLQKVLNKFNGLHYPQEYLCLAGDIFEQPLRAYLVSGGRVVQDITNLHSFVGYHPLVLALPEKIAGSDIIEIAFSSQSLPPNETLSKKDAIAKLRLRKIQEASFQHGAVHFYEGLTGSHQFVSSFHQYIIGINNRLFNRKKGNVFLKDDLYKQVQIAYALPRNISLISVGQQDNYNLFPTDLHGPADENHYLVSLRFSGKACRQVENAGAVLICRIANGFYKTAYALGKNHMQELKAKQHFPFSDAMSDQLHLPLPESTISYQELRLQDSFNHGIHKIMLFEVISTKQVQDHSSALAHIHNTYATWRHNNRLPGNFLLR